MRKVLKFIGLPLTYVSALWLRFVKSDNGDSVEDKIFMHVGILPLIDHYYEPMINPKRDFKDSYEEDRLLVGINFNIENQLKYLKSLSYSEELSDISFEKIGKNEYHYQNKNFEFVDADALYNVIRHEKPQKIIEIGAGFSSLMIQKAVQANLNFNSHKARHICIEPYENEWLEQLDIELVRKPIEEMDMQEISTLGRNDILFVDSSHMIRPSGDVLYIMQNIIPNLAQGVLIHIHDIFTPRHYPQHWVENHRFWNEQYLLESFLTFNKDFEIVLSINHLYHNYKNELTQAFPVTNKVQSINPGSFWLRKIK